MPIETPNANEASDSNDRPWSNVCRVLEDATIAELSDSQLLERILAEQRESGSDINAPIVEDYLTRFPQLKTKQEWSLDLVYNEFLARRENANALNQQPPAPDEYLERFPDLSSALHDQFQLYMGLDSGFVQGDDDSPELKSAPNDEGLIGRVFGQRYEIKERLGQGGFAFVYKAWDNRLRRLVAVKLSRFVFEPNSKQAKRFAREAESIARLSHPGILQVYEVGEFEGRPFFVGQLAEGGSLARQLQNGALDETTIVNWMIEICEAVEYSHQFGVVHRDLKPANILFHNQSPKIADFGLASMTESEINLTIQGDLVGTPAYMSPEQARGATEVIDASDQYSLGVILFQSLTGNLPFEGTTTQLIQQVIESDPPVPRSINSNISLDLQTICLKAMAKLPEQRYVSIREMAADLRRFQAHEPILARPIGWAGKIKRWCLRQPALAATLFAATLLLVAISWISVNRIATERDRFRGERDRANTQLFASLVSNAENSIAAKPAGWWQAAYDALLEAKPLTDSPNEISWVRELMIKLLVDDSLRLAKTSDSYESNLPATAIAADSKDRFVAIGDEAGHIQIRSLDLQTKLIDLPSPSNHEGTVKEICLIQNTSQLVARIGETVWVWQLIIETDTQSGSALRSGDPTLLVEHATCIDCSANKATLAIGIPSKLLIFEDIKDGWLKSNVPKQTQTWDIGNTTVECISFSSTRPNVAIGSADSVIQVWSLATASQLNYKRILHEPVRHIAYWRDNIVWSDSTSFATYFWQPSSGQESKTNLFPSSVNGTTTLNGLPICTTTEGRIYIVSSSESLKDNPQSGLSVGGFGELACTTTSNRGNSIYSAYRNGHIQRWQMESSSIARHWTGIQPLCLTQDGQLFNAWHGIDIAGKKTSTARTTATHSPPIELSQTDRNTNDLFCIEGRDLVCRRHDSGKIDRLENLTESIVTDLSVDAESRKLFVLDEKGTVIAIRLDDLRILTKRQVTPGKTTQLAAYGSEILLVEDNQVKLLTEQGDSPIELPGLTGPRGYHFIVNENEIVAIQTENDIKMYRFGDWENELGTFNSPTPIQYCAITKNVSTSQPLLAIVDSNDLLTVWDVESNTVTHQFELLNNSDACHFDPLGKFLIVSEQHREAEVYELSSGQRIAELESSSEASGVKFSRDGKSIWLIGQGVMQIDRSKLESAFRETRKMEPEAPSTRIDCDFHYIVPGRACHHIWSVDVSPNGLWNVATGQDRCVRIREIGDHRIAHFLTEHDDVVWSCDFSNDSKILATGSVRERRGEVIVWGTDTWKPLRRLYVGNDLISGLQFHPSLPLLAATCFDGSAWLLNFETGETIKQLLPKGPRSMDAEFTTDGKYLAVAQTSLGTSVFEITSDQSQFNAELHRHLPDHNERIWTLAFSDDGQSLVTATQSGLVRFYSMPELSKVVTIETSSKGIRQLKLSVDSQQLVFSSWPFSNGQIIDLNQLRAKLADLGLDW